MDPKSEELWAKMLSSKKFSAMKVKEFRQQEHVRLIGVFCCLTCKMAKTCLAAGLHLSAESWNMLGELVLEVVDKKRARDEINFNQDYLRDIFDALMEPFCGHECKDRYYTKRKAVPKILL